MTLEPMGVFAKPTEPFPADEYRARLAKLDRQLRKDKLDAMLVVTDVNRLYLTGFQASNGLLLLRPGKRATFYTDFRYLEAARDQLGFLNVEKLGKAADQLGPLAKRGKWALVGYEGALPGARLQAFKDALPAVKEWRNAEGAVLDMRAIKSPRELAVLSVAVCTGDDAFDRFLRDVRPGLSEWEMRRMIRRKADDLSQGESFDCIVCVGANASRCHHHPGATVLKKNNELLVDMGVLVQGYHSDMTRTVFYGKPPKKFVEIYKVVLAANRAAIRAIRPGRKGKEIDAVARRIIEKAGYGKYFDHGLGHGVGLEIHERPAFSKTDETVLRPGMVMTVEPGIYIPGFGGVRIEDMVAVTRKGCTVLTQTPKKLRCL